MAQQRPLYTHGSRTLSYAVVHYFHLSIHLSPYISFYTFVPHVSPHFRFSIWSFRWELQYSFRARDRVVARTPKVKYAQEFRNRRSVTHIYVTRSSARRRRKGQNLHSVTIVDASLRSNTPISDNACEANAKKMPQNLARRSSRWSRFLKPTPLRRV